MSTSLLENSKSKEVNELSLIETQITGQEDLEEGEIVESSEEEEADCCQHNIKSKVSHDKPDQPFWDRGSSKVLLGTAFDTSRASGVRNHKVYYPENPTPPQSGGGTRGRKVNTIWMNGFHRRYKADEESLPDWTGGTDVASLQGVSTDETESQIVSYPLKTEGNSTGDANTSGKSGSSSGHDKCDEDWAMKSARGFKTEFRTTDRIKEANKETTGQHVSNRRRHDESAITWSSAYSCMDNNATKLRTGKPNKTARKVSFVQTGRKAKTKKRRRFFSGKVKPNDPLDARYIIQRARITKLTSKKRWFSVDEHKLFEMLEAVNMVQTTRVDKKNKIDFSCTEEKNGAGLNRVNHMQKEKKIKLSLENDVDEQLEVMARKEIEEAMSEAVIKACSSCGKRFTQEGSCHLIECTCGTRTCFACGCHVARNRKLCCCDVDLLGKLPEMLRSFAAQRAKIRLLQDFPSLKFIYDHTC